MKFSSASTAAASLAALTAVTFTGAQDAEAQQRQLPPNIAQGTNITKIYNGGVVRADAPDFQMRVSTNTGRTRLVDINVCDAIPSRKGDRTVGITAFPSYAASFNPRDVPNPPDIQAAYNIRYPDSALRDKVVGHAVDAHGVKVEEVIESSEMTKLFFRASRPYSAMTPAVFGRFGISGPSDADAVCDYAFRR